MNRDENTQCNLQKQRIISDFLLVNHSLQNDHYNLFSCDVVFLQDDNTSQIEHAHCEKAEKAEKSKNDKVHVISKICFGTRNIASRKKIMQFSQ